MEQTLHEGPHNIKGTGEVTYCPPSCPAHFRWKNVCGPAIRVWLGVPRQRSFGLQHHSVMWCGACNCGKTWQYFDHGATLGAGLEHLRRCRI
jgi:hypothetical protein